MSEKQNTINELHNEAYAEGNKTLMTTIGTALGSLIQEFNTQYGALMTQLSISNQQIMPYIYAIELGFINMANTNFTTFDNNAKTRVNMADL